MSVVRVQSAAEQVANHLQHEIATGLRSGAMPGVGRLAAELGVNHKTVESALRLLEKEGAIINQGERRGRLIAPLGDKTAPQKLRIAVLRMETADPLQDFMIELQHLLEEAGHVPFYVEKTLLDLKMDVRHIAQLVKSTRADAWLIAAGSRDVLNWFSRQATPSFALFGRREDVDIAAAGPRKTPIIADATRHLIGLGHRRISMVIRSQHRLPEPEGSARAFLDELEAAGLPSGAFNLPDWDESKEGFATLLGSLFEHTPPTALILDEAFLFNAAFYFLAHRGLRVPEDVSLLSTDADHNFAWCEPSVAHIRWNYRPVVRRVVRWANNVAHGKEDRRQTLTKAEFIDGGTIAPPKA